MSAAVAALLGAFIGAFAGIASGILLEGYRRHCDRRGTASALAGEVAGICRITDQRRYVDYFTNVLTALETNKDVRIPPMIAKPLELDPIFQRHIERLGMLSGDLPEQVTTFYTYLIGIKYDLHRLASGEFEGKPNEKARLIREDLRIWSIAREIAEAIIPRLLAVARQTYFDELCGRDASAAKPSTPQAQAGDPGTA